MRILLTIINLLVVVCVFSQVRYSTRNKKAIKLFEQGQEAPSKSIDPVRNIPNYAEGVHLMNKALEKDPNFWEAHVFAGEFCEYIGDNVNAILHYEAAIQINPNHSPTGSTYFYLANLQLNTGDYTHCISTIKSFQSYRNVNPEMIREANHMLRSCEFALNAIQHPYPFDPVNVGPGINTKDPEYYPTLTIDGKTMLFTRLIDDNRSQHFKKQEDFFVSHYDTVLKKWGQSIPMPSNINSAFNEGAPSISADGRSLIFVACEDQTGNQNYGENRMGRGSCDLFITKKIGSRWTNPVNLPGNVNSFFWESQPSLSADGKTLYFIRKVNKPGEQPNSDIFISQLDENGQWMTPKRLPSNINTTKQEESVLIHPDGKTLYFSSRGHLGMGGLDIYVTYKDDKGQWSDPKNLGYPINTFADENSLMVSADGNIAYFASNREGSFGELDIYSFNLPPELKPTKTIYFDGKVFDAISLQPIPGKFQLINLKTNEEVIVSEADKLTGEFMVSLPLDCEYALNVSYTGYTFYSNHFNLIGSLDEDAFHMDIPMIPITSEQPVLLANVFFDLNKASIRPESNIELNKLVSFLQNNVSINIEISGHTDTRGDENENLKLSTERAKSVYDYLINKGIDAKRLTYKGYGETKPVISEATIFKMTTDREKEAAHQSNRRTEYKIIQ
jgi:outer membrane protein OmpA-like peptidoglycan-associated protein